ncbi:transcriptional regulator [Plectonema radiosum NIES-515]|uniref:Transcriptional regulator n=1 Tax=Plectonema radiosum NIES-515 TaxID=2986073 RepID=A0ABT3ASR7_9CYAN|nr:transcriptional regulator [Plectonema radiosum]MCV3212163.1 transcriptional regulator [Plectonema radiosum NIES-515]
MNEWGFKPLPASGRGLERGLLLIFTPMCIRNEEENEKALAIVEELMHRSNLTLEENELYELLIILIEKFEQKHYSPGQASTPHSMLLFMMEQKEIQQSELVGVIGSKRIVSEIVNGKR